MIPLDSFVGQSADGKMVPIIPGGNSIPLTFSNRKEYVERAIEYRLHEMDRQVRWNTMVPGGLHALICPDKSTCITSRSGHCLLSMHGFTCISVSDLIRDFLGHAYHPHP